jgi:hypothetical protein
MASAVSFGLIVLSSRLQALLSLSATYPPLPFHPPAHHPSPNCGESPNPLLLCYLLLPHLHPPLLNQQFVRADNAKACDLCWKPLSWLGTISLTSANDVLDPVLWETFFSTTLGSVVPLLSSLLHHNNSPHVQCGCKKLRMDFRIRRT